MTFTRTVALALLLLALAACASRPQVRVAGEDFGREVARRVAQKRFGRP
jgi:hypothetical protein